jgi:formate hydrogenlyase subunit 3/multisubunit Na+/H+ antiporter MnhD subunit
VHLPIALAVLLPLFAVGALWFIRRGARPRAAWGVTVAMAAALLASSWVSLQTGEQQEERVEDVVSEASIHQHEEAAELFMVVSGGVLVLAIGGLAGGRVAKVSRWLTVAGTIGVFAAGWNVGHSGGMLVYRDGAASAYVNANGQGRVQGAPGDADEERDGRGDGRE